MIEILEAIVRDGGDPIQIGGCIIDNHLGIQSKVSTRSFRAVCRYVMQLPDAIGRPLDDVETKQHDVNLFGSGESFVRTLVP